MSVTFEESMIDFDINFLQPSATPIESQLEKQRKQIARVKKKTILTSAIINQNSIWKKKCAEYREKWERNEVLLLTSKEECKQACINYQESVGKCSQLEKDLETERNLNVELGSKYSLSQDQYEGMKSYANQLQTLIKKYEADIDGLKAEKISKKDHNIDDCDKKLTLVQEEKTVLLKHLSLATDIIMGKRKLRKRHKILLQKYNNLEVSDDDSSSDSGSEQPDFLDDPPNSPHSSVFTSCEDAGDKIEDNIFKTNISEATIKKDLIKFNKDDDSDFSNEVPSEDTGRGSSLAFSDKCFSSPDYFNPNSPIRENIKVNEKSTLVDSATSPIRNIATSPRIFDDEILLSDTNTLLRHVQDSNTKEYFITDETPFSDEIITIKERRTLVEAGTSPIQNSEWNSSEYIISSEIPLSNEIVTIRERRTLVETGTSPIQNSEWNSSEYIISGEIPLSNEIVTIKEKRKLLNVGTSPIIDIERVHTATSPLSLGECMELDKLYAHSMLVAEDVQTCNVNDYRRSEISSRKTPCILIDDTLSGVNGKHTKIDNLTSHCELEISEKSIEERKCLERNNSKNFSDADIDDGEIEMILNTMRLAFSPVSPIPTTPVNIHLNRSGNVLEPAQSLSEFCGENEVSREVILSKENKILRTDLEHLKREMVDVKKQIDEMKSLFKNSKSNEEVLTESNICANPETFDDMSQDTIIIYPNDENSDRSEENELASAIDNFNMSIALRNSESTQLIDAGVSESAQNILQNNSITSCISKQLTSRIAPKSRHVEISQCSKNINSIEDELSSHTDVPVSKNDSRESITFEEDIISVEENDIIMNTDTDYILEDLNNCGKYKKRRNAKLSKLDKFKQKLQPKCKISKPASVRKLRSKMKLRPVTVTLAKLDPNVILNNKLAYEHAAKVMAEEKAKEKDSSIKKRVGRKTKKDNTSLKQQQQQSKGNVNQTQRELRQKSKDQQDSNDKYSESFEEVDWQNDVSRITRSRSRKLSISTNISSIQEDTTEKDISFSGRKRKSLKREATDRPIFDKKRVLRSTNQETCIDLENVQKAKWSDIAETIPIKPCHKLSDSGTEEQIITHYVKNDRNVPSKILNRKWSKTENKEQITENIKNASNTPKREGEGNSDRNIINASNIPKNVKDRKPSSDENKNQNLSDSVKNIFKSNKTQERKLSTSQNDKQNPTNSLNNNSEIPNDGKKCNRNKTEADEPISHPKNSILCKMLEKHGRGGIKFHKTVPDNTINCVCKRLEENIASITELPAAKAKLAMNKLLDDIQGWEERPFMLGLMQYLKDPNRKNEQFNRVNCPPAPDMTKAEQVLLYIVRQMENTIPNTLNIILSHIEYSLFKLNRTPDFDIIESLSRFYALLCRYFGLKTRLRLFILDAMYCLKYKVIPLIKQCLDVWMHILPLAHMGIAKSPLVTSLVYLLHFYKCEDKYKKRALEIRIILKRKYFYEIPDWNEPMFLEMFRNAIKEVRDIPAEKKMLRTALIILGKRKGPQWCNQNIIKSMLMPMIERDNIPMKTKQFCVQMLGPLLKPFPADMKVHFEIAANYLYEMLDQNPPDTMKEAIFTSLIYIGHHNPNRLTRSLLSWMPKKVSPEFEEVMKDYVRVKTLVTWKKILQRISI